MKNTVKTQLWYNVSRRIAIISLVFASFLGVLLVLNDIQTKQADPLKSKALNELMMRLRENPDDQALKEQIRALDLLARKAYFTHLWQIRTGAYVLFAFVLVFLAAMKLMNSFRARFPDLAENPAFEQSWIDNSLARRAIILGGLIFFGYAFALGLRARDDLGDIVVFEKKAPGEAPSYAAPEEMQKNWPNFRGPNGVGVAYADSAPIQWNGSSGDHILWKTEIPVPGFNSPIVWEKKIFLSGADRKIQVAYCVDADTGSILWQKEIDNVPGSPEKKPENTADTGLAAPTMATDGVRVFVIFGTGDAAALDFEGNLIWAKNLGVPENHYGHSSSLITWRNLLLVQYDQNTGGHLIALDSKSGELIYDQRREIDISWASPILVNTGTRDEVILNSSPAVVSYDPATGRELYRVDCMSGEVAPSLAYADGMVFAVNANAKLAAIPLDGTPKVLWESKEDLSEVSSPLATRDFVFVAASYGTISCFDSKTGERYWYEDLPQGFYSSPILAGNNIYLMDRDGLMYIFKPGKKFDLVNTCELGENAVAVPAFMPGRIYIRGFKHLYGIGG